MSAPTQTPEYIKTKYAALKLQMTVLEVMIRDNAPLYFLTEAIERVFEKAEDLRHDKKKEEDDGERVDEDDEGASDWGEVCCLCGEEIKTLLDAHFPAPLAKSGSCCSTCNQTKVLPARLSHK